MLRGRAPTATRGAPERSSTFPPLSIWPCPYTPKGARLATRAPAVYTPSMADKPEPTTDVEDPETYKGIQRVLAVAAHTAVVTRPAPPDPAGPHKSKLHPNMRVDTHLLGKSAEDEAAKRKKGTLPNLSVSMRPMEPKRQAKRYVGIGSMAPGRGKR